MPQGEGMGKGEGNIEWSVQWLSVFHCLVVGCDKRGPRDCPVAPVLTGRRADGLMERMETLSSAPSSDWLNSTLVRLLPPCLLLFAILFDSVTHAHTLFLSRSLRSFSLSLSKVKEHTVYPKKWKNAVVNVLSIHSISCSTKKKLTNQICRSFKNYSFVSCWLCDAQNKLWHVWQTDSLVFCVLQLVLCVCLFVIAFLINTIVLGSSDIIQHYFNHVEQQQKNDLFHPFSEPIRDAAFTEQKFSNQRLKP